MKPILLVVGPLMGLGYIIVLPLVGVLAILLFGTRKLGLVLKAVLK